MTSSFVFFFFSVSSQRRLSSDELFTTLAATHAHEDAFIFSFQMADL